MRWYEKRLRERFWALTQDVLWKTIEEELAVGDAFLDDYDEQWWPRLQAQCLAISKRLGLPFGAATCTRCDRLWPELGEKPDRESCPICEQQDAEREQQRAAEIARLEAMSPEERAARQSVIRLIVSGLVGRDVQ